MPSMIDATQPVYGSPTTQSVRANFAIAHDEISALQATYLPLAGGAMTGPLLLSAAPSAANGAATKSYVDGVQATYLPLAGGAMTGPLLLSAAPSAANGAATKSYVDGVQATYLPLAGGAMTGPLLLSGPPSAANGAATKSYVDGVQATYLPLAGGTLTGPLLLSGPPSAANGAATKSYVDGFLPLAGGTLSGLLTAAAGALLNANTTVNLNAAPGAALAGGLLRLSQVDGVAARMSIDSFGLTNVFSGLLLRNAAGTLAAMTPLPSGAEIGRIGFMGCNTAGVFPTASVLQTGLRCLTTEAWTGSTSAAALEIDTIVTGSTTAAKRATFDANFTITGAGFQPGGGSWTASSDARLKQDVEPYRSGLAEIGRLNPISWRYNGLTEIADTETVHHGLAAEEVREVMPEMIRIVRQKLHEDDLEPVDVLHVNSTALTFALVNAVSELARRLDRIERI